MAAFNGKWSLVEAQNGAAYFTAINSPDEYKEKLRKVNEMAKADPNAYIEELKVDKAAGTIQRAVYINGEKRKDSGEVKLGVDHDAHSADGRSAKVKLTLESDTKIVRSEVGDGFTTSTSFEVAGDQLTLTAVGNGVTFISKLKRV